MLQSRQIAWPAYFVAVAMVVIPLADAWTTLFPWNFGDARWRFGAAGLLSNVLVLPLAGFLVTLIAAWAGEQRYVLRAIAIVGALGALLSVLGLVSFALDALQTRSQVRPEMRLSFNVAAITAATKMSMAGLTFLVIGSSGWKASRSMWRKKKRSLEGLFVVPRESAAVHADAK